MGEPIDHILPVLWGGGSNGKSLITEVMLDVFGEYGDKASPELLLEKHGTAHPTEKADLHGKRLVLATETDAGRRLSESVVKELTGGDTIHARRMREDFWSFRPSHTVMLVTNHKPRVVGTDHGIWRRLALVPFNVRFWDADKGETGPEELKADKALKAKLKPELGGILRRLVAGCLEWQRGGLRLPKAVTDATSIYRAAEDVLADFIEDNCRLSPEGECKASDLRSRYEEWAKRCGEKPISNRRLGEYLADRGVEKRRSNGLFYTGILLL